ncbi:hypothetical protein HMPREF9374_3333 [Desmospora sp. 8437]|nr:hypothetical protein HMPREF9374_3333 [Desmospora sp. 8437]
MKPNPDGPGPSYGFIRHTNKLDRNRWRMAAGLSFYKKSGYEDDIMAIGGSINHPIGWDEKGEG